VFVCVCLCVYAYMCVWAVCTCAHVPIYANLYFWDIFCLKLSGTS